MDGTGADVGGFGTAGMSIGKFLGDGDAFVVVGLPACGGVGDGDLAGDYVCGHEGGLSRGGFVDDGLIGIIDILRNEFALLVEALSEQFAGLAFFK